MQLLVDPTYVLHLSAKDTGPVIEGPSVKRDAIAPGTTFYLDA